MKWTRARKLGLAASIAPIFMLFSYFISFITVDIGILASKETDLLELIKTANEYADMFDVSLFEAISDQLSDVLSDVSDSIAPIILVSIFCFLVPMLLDTASSIIGFVFFGKKKDTHAPHIFAIVTAGYTVIADIVLVCIFNALNKEINDEIGINRKFINVGAGFYIQLVFCVALIVVSILAFIALKKEEHPIDSADVGLVGVKGMWAGAQFINNTGEGLVVGRDPKQCNIIISQNANSISRKHCVVKYDYQTKDYEVTDCSSNGTYVAETGQRLKYGVPTHLPCGTVIELGDLSNSFMIN